MAQGFVLFLISISAFLILAMASEPDVAPSSYAEAPSSYAEAPAIRKLGKHRHKLARFSAESPHLSPSALPQNKDDHLSPLGHQDPESGHMQEIHLKKPHHHAVDKSVAGGGVILGGLATTFLVAIFCYIRATRRSNPRLQPSSP